MEILASVEAVQAIDLEVGSGTDVVFVDNDGNLSVMIGSQQYALTEETFADAGRMAGIHESYIKKCPVHLLIPHLNYWYNHGKMPTVRFLHDTQQVVGMTNKKVAMVFTGELLEEVEKVIGAQNIIGYHKPVVSLDFTRIPIVCQANRDILPNDKFYGGLYLQNSMLGTKTLEIASYLFQEVCTNGMISMQNFLKWSRRNLSYSVLTWAKDSAQAAYAAISTEFDAVHKLTTVKLDQHVSEAVKSIFQDFNIPVQLQKEIMEEIISKGATTLYDVFCAVTRIGTHSEAVDKNPYNGRKLQLIGSSITQHPSVCNACHRILKD